MLGIMMRRPAYRKALYVLLALPLGLAYYLLIAVGLLVDLILLPWRVAVALLTNTPRFVIRKVRQLASRLRRRHSSTQTLAPDASGTRLRTPLWLSSVVLWWRIAAFERYATMRLVEVDIPPLSPPWAAGESPSVRPRRYLSDPQTWTILLYLLAKLPLGLLAAGVLVVSIAALELLVALESDSLPLLLLLITALLVADLHLFGMLAQTWGRFTSAMLSLSATARWLAETEALAERERAKAERAEQSRRELVVNASHELRTPVASIRGHLESLLLMTERSNEGASMPPELPKYLGIAHREAERLSMLVDELLSLARAEARELHLELMPVAASEVLEEVYDALAPLARRERRVTLVCEARPDMPPVLADRERLVQVLLNLVRNAITHTQEGGVVWLDVEQVGEDKMALAVTDMGVGIAPEDLERIWERFYRVDESRVRATGGSGLGLTIVRELVEAMGGSVSVESKEGEGTCFCVVLRVAPASPGVSTTSK